MRSIYLCGGDRMRGGHNEAIQSVALLYQKMAVNGKLPRQTGICQQWKGRVVAARQLETSHLSHSGARRTYVWVVFGEEFSPRTIGELCLA